MKFVVIAGSVRSDRRGIRAAWFVERSLAARGHDVTLVDPLDVELPLLDRMYKEYPTGEAPEVLERLALVRFAVEFEWYAAALSRARKEGVPY